MTKLQTWELNDTWTGAQMIKEKDGYGDWVCVDDVEKLEEENKKLKEEIEKLQEQLKKTKQ